MPALSERPDALSTPSSTSTGSPLRIVHTVSSLNVGGMEQFALRIAGAQLRAGHQVTVMALNGGPLEERARQQEIPVKVLGGGNKYLRLLNGLLTMRALRPEIVNAHNPTSLHYAMLGKRFGGARVVMTDHNAPKNARQGTPAELRALDQVIPVSRHTGRNLKQPELRGKITPILNGVEPPRLRKSRAEIRAELGLGDRLVGIMVGRLHPGKGHDCLLRAIHQVREAGVDLCTLLCGDGQERPAIEALAKELGLGPNHLKLLGFRNDVPDVVAAADLFLFPSEDEGLPLSVLEAMVVGCPVIATPVGGIPEIVTPEEHGLLIPVNDHATLAAAIQRLAGEPETRGRMSATARSHAERELSFATMVERYEALYRQLLGQA